MFEIGNSLREARIRQQLEFAEMETRTKVRTRYLRALEEEDFDALPAQTYVRGFLRSYADALGLDGQLYVDEFNSRFVVGDEDHHPTRPRRSAVARPRQQHRFETNVVLLALVAIAAVTALVIAAWRFGGTGGAVTPPATPPATRHKAASPARAVPLAPKARLVVVATRGNSLLEVHAGSARGRLLYHGTLERGERETFVGTRIWLDVGTPENLSVRLNGRRVSIGSGAPRVLVVTREAIVPAAATG